MSSATGRARRVGAGGAGVPAPAPDGPAHPTATDPLCVSAADVAASSPFAQPEAATEYQKIACGDAAPPGKHGGGGTGAAGGKDEGPGGRGEEEELAPGLLPKLPWRENPLITKVGAGRIEAAV